jgi:hypothetical protein
MTPQRIPPSPEPHHLAQVFILFSLENPKPLFNTHTPIVPSSSSLPRPQTNGHRQDHPARLVHPDRGAQPVAAAVGRRCGHVGGPRGDGDAGDARGSDGGSSAVGAYLVGRLATTRDVTLGCEVTLSQWGFVPSAHDFRDHACYALYFVAGGDAYRVGLDEYGEWKLYTAAKTPQGGWFEITFRPVAIGG